MSNTKHTPGPWSVDGHNLTAVIGVEIKQGITQEWTTYKHICDCNYGHAVPEAHFEENRANAKLIAAAPEMYRLLKEISQLVGDQLYIGDAINIIKSIDNE